MINPEPLTVGIAEAIRLTNLGRSSLYCAIRNGHIAVRKAGRRTLIETAELRRFIEQLPNATDK
jgi:excisionase family DNA binding protein